MDGGRRCGVSEIIAWIAAAAESDHREPSATLPPVRQGNGAEKDLSLRADSLQHLPVHQFPVIKFPATAARSSEPPPGAHGKLEVERTEVESADEAVGNIVASSGVASSETGLGTNDAGAGWARDPLYTETDLESDVYEEQRRRRVYRGRTAAMLQRYMRYALETGRIPSILGGDIFRSKVTSYGVSTFEDRAIFVHDMERCLQRLDELSRQVLARVVLQGHNRDEAAHLLGCTRRTIHRNLTDALDRMADILLAVGLLEAIPVAAPGPEASSSSPATSTEGAFAPVEKSCQGGEAVDFLLSDCEDGK